MEKTVRQVHDETSIPLRTLYLAAKENRLPVRIVGTVVLVLTDHPLYVEFVKKHKEYKTKRNKGQEE